MKILALSILSAFAIAFGFVSIIFGFFAFIVTRDFSLTFGFIVGGLSAMGFGILGERYAKRLSWR
jgi:hypothetical protein